MLRHMLKSFFGKKEEVNYKELIQQGAIIVDVRSKEEFDLGHVKDVINIPLGTLSSNTRKLGSTDAHIITCCASGGRSSVAKGMLHKLGYKNVHNGGGWSSLRTKI